ncbi:MAG: LacI family DNA-binding transcriptional regulator [Verrucomicrobia bacterium]|nr:LacI family DNA-binding transcriptional regulator [Verrucomicrobiota bacterium]
MQDSSVENRISISDVARHIGVSTATVSLALNSKGRISRQTRHRVLAACKQLEYHPHPAARFLPSLRSLSNARIATNTIGFTPVLDPKDAATYLNFLYGITSVARREHKAILYQPLEKGFEADLELTNHFQVDGRILVGSVDDSALEAFQSEDAPLMVLGDHRCQRPVWNVNSDNAVAGRMAVEHLWNLGHRRIGVFCEPNRTAYQDEFVRGIQDALQKQGGELAPDLMRTNRAGELERLLALLRSQDRPTAFIAVQWDCATVLESHAREAGLIASKDLDVVVFGILPSERIVPPFAYIDQGYREMGRRAMEILIHLAGKRDQSTSCRTLVQPILIRPNRD